MRDPTMAGMSSRSGLRLLHVHAHPDDESSKGAASTARYVSEGVEVHVATCTGGERGSILNPRFDREVTDMVAERRREMAAAAEILGIQQHWLGFVDSGWHGGDPNAALPAGCFADEPLEESLRVLVALVRSVRPQVMTTYDESGGYAHPDHVQCHHLAVAAFEAAGDATRFPEAGPAWQPAKLYYHHAFNHSRLQALHDAMVASGQEWPRSGPFSLLGKRREDSGRVTTRVRCDDYFDVRDAALRAHATQIDPDGGWFAIPRDVERRAWPTEDFELARSHVEVTLPEDDLFAGLTPDDVDD